VNSWEPPTDLTRLLEALAQEVVASTEADVHMACIGGRPSVPATSLEVDELFSRIRELGEVDRLVSRIRELVAITVDETGEAEPQLPFAEDDHFCDVRQRPH
jgi:hypothetical protein